AAQGDGQDPTGAVIPAADVTPTVEITPGTEVIDGVPFVFEAVAGGEAADELVIKLPEQGVLVAQDLVCHATHLFLGNNDIAGRPRWQRPAYGGVRAWLPPTSPAANPWASANRRSRRARRPRCRVNRASPVPGEPGVAGAG